MLTPAPNVKRAQALHRHLSANASECIKRNIIVHVDSINTEQSIAFCTVEQRITGLFRRTYDVGELVWRAEQALAPLIGLGVMPMITARHTSLRNTSVVAPVNNGRLHMDWITGLWRWLGSPMQQEGFGAVTLVNDPFGWRQAMHASGSK